MNRERELLQRALEAVEKTYFPSRLADELRAELQKPEPVVSEEVTFGADDYRPFGIAPGRYKMLIVRIDDD